MTATLEPLHAEARTQPHDHGAEQAVLGSMLLSKDAINDVVDMLKPGDFYNPRHLNLYNAIVALYTRNEPVDAITLTRHLIDTGKVGEVGGAPYVHDLTRAVPIAANARYYARIIRDLAGRRRLIEATTRISHMAYAGPRDADEDLNERATQLLYGAIADQLDTSSHTTASILQETFDEIDAASRGETNALPTGMHDLDRVLGGGLFPGQLVIPAARTGGGKSILALDFARHAALREGRGVEFFSLEMTRTDVMKRLLSAECGVPFYAIRTGNLTDDQWTKLARVGAQITESGLHIDTTPGQTVASIGARARKRAQRDDLGLIVVDYLALIQPGRRAESRQMEITEISRGLKLLGMELEVPVVAPAQVNRNPESRADKVPQLSDLRESGSLENDADVVIIIHRLDYHDKEHPRAGEVDLHVLKNRNGAPDTVTAAAQLHLMRFVDMAI